MNTSLKEIAAGVAAVVCVGFTAGIAVAGNPHTTTTTTTATGQTTTVPSQAKAYGFYCAQQNESKAHVAGQQGTPYSQCVTAMAKLRKGTTSSPQVACAALSKQHIAGQTGTPFSKCVSAGAKLLKSNG